MSRKKKAVTSKGDPPSQRTGDSSSRTQTNSKSASVQGASTSQQDVSDVSKSPMYMLLAIPILFTIIICSLVTWAYRRALDPLYGSIPTDLHLNKAVWGATLLAGLLPSLSGWKSTGLLGATICAVPGLAYWVAVFTGSRLKDPIIGPAITHAVVLGPVIYFGVSVVKSTTLVLESHNEGSMMRFTILPACASSITGFMPVWNDVIPMILGYASMEALSDAHILLIIGGVCIALWSISLPLRAEKDANSNASFRLSWHILVPALLIPVLPIILPRIIPPAPFYPHVTPHSRTGTPVRILSSVQSVTGTIVVGESLPPSGAVPHDYPSDLRYLRASHSLLGGVWVGNNVPPSYSKSPYVLKDAFGTTLGDSIYNAFLSQEAVRLVDKSNRDIGSEQETALIIGLGAGIAAAALMKHNVDVSIIEIDPAVYNASVMYFGLPEPAAGRLFLNDARHVVYEKRLERQQGVSNEHYDYVIHDCFSGGGVPSHIFTIEFWEDLKAILNPDGILAVNYAGIVGSDASRAVYLTLQKSFGRCRIFHDSLTPLSEKEMLSEFRNLVIFCSPSSKPLEFRAAVPDDYLDSPLRSHVLGSFGPEREVEPRLVIGDIGETNNEKWILRDQGNRLGEWQKSGAFSHWKIMRGILPEVFWTTY